MTIKTTWDKLGTWQKRLSILAGILGALIAIVGPVWAGAKVLATDAEVDAKIAVVQKSFDEYAAKQDVRDKQKAIQEAQWRIEEIEYRLLDPNLPEVQRATLQRSKTKLEKRIDCIQSGKEFCG